jgi:MFS family permease
LVDAAPVLARPLRPFMAAMVIDALGSGFYLPFSVLFFVAAQGVPVGVVGGSLAVASALMIPLSAAVGPAVDRWGPRPVLVAGNALRSVAFVLYVFADNPARAALVIGVSVVLDKFCWVAQAALIGNLAAGSESRRLFGIVSWSRNLGIGVGSAVGGIGASLWGNAGLYAVVLANAASYAAAAVLLSRFAVPPPAGPPAAPPDVVTGTATPGGGYRQVLRDRSFLLLVGAKFCFVACAIAVATFLPYYLVAQGGLPTWVAGLVLTANCALVVLLQLGVTRRLAPVPGRLLLAAGGLAYAAGGLLFLAAGRLPVALAAAGALAGMVAYTLGEIVIAPSSDSLAVELAPAAKLGRYQSVYQLSWSLGSIVVPAAGALLLDAAPGWFWLAFVALAACGAALSLAVPSPRATQGLAS